MEWNYKSFNICFLMPSFTLNITNNQPIIDADIGHPEDRDKVNRYKAILDTGAQRTLVSPKVVEDLVFTPIGDAPFRNVNGSAEYTMEFQMLVGIPVQIGSAVFVFGGNMKTLLLPHQPSYFDLLLGMDFLSGYHITLYNNQMIMSN